MHSLSKTVSSALILMALAVGTARSGIADTRLKGGAGDGKIAKYQFTLHDNMVVTSVAWSPDGKYIAASSLQTVALHLWDVAKRKLIANIPRDNTGEFGELTWSPDGRFLPLCSGYGKLKVYSGSNFADVRIISQASGRSCDKVAFSSDGSRLATLGITSHTLDVYSTSGWQSLRHSDNLTGWARGRALRSIAYVPGSLILAIGGGEFEQRGRITVNNGFIYFFDAEEEVPSRTIQAYRYEESSGPPAT